jgi:Kef-type K+ transport system membrane component KefB
MTEILALSLLLAAGFTLAQLVKLGHLPFVTGFIIAGVFLGRISTGNWRLMSWLLTPASIPFLRLHEAMT